MTRTHDTPRRVAVINTHATHGGAAKAALRHHLALRKAGVESTMLTLQPACESQWPEGVETIENPALTPDRAAYASLIKRAAIDGNRTPLSDTWYSWPLQGADLASHPAVRDADALSVHWVSGLLSMTGLETLFTLGKPVVFTMHDEWLFTGGCHYTAGCEGFRADCERCPQLAADPVGVPAAVMRRRLRLGREARGSVVTPSKWLGEQSARSAAFQTWDHAVVPYACDLDAFTPADRDEIRAKLELDPAAAAAGDAPRSTDPGKIWLMFIADNLADRRKGFDVLGDALAQIPDARERFGIVCAGAAPDVAEVFGLETRAVGLVTDDRRLAGLYAACDALVLPSREDNLPNTMLESLCCGSPVIGARVGGIPDFVTEGETGHLFVPGDPASLAETLRGLSRDALAAMRPRCREVAEASFAPETHAERWLEFARSTPVSEGFAPGAEEPLLETAGALVCALSGEYESGGTAERLVRLTYERRLASTVARLRDSEKDRADRLAHIHGLGEQIQTQAAQIRTLTADLETMRRQLDARGGEMGSLLSRLEAIDEVHAVLPRFNDREEASERERAALRERTEALEAQLRSAESQRDVLRDRLDRSLIERLARIVRPGDGEHQSERDPGQNPQPKGEQPNASAPSGSSAPSPHSEGKTA